MKTLLYIIKSSIDIIIYKEKYPYKDVIISLVIGEKIHILASVLRVDFDEIHNNYKTTLEFKYIEKDKWEILNKFLDEKLKGI